MRLSKIGYKRNNAPKNNINFSNSTRQSGEQRKSIYRKTANCLCEHENMISKRVKDSLHTEIMFFFRVYRSTTASSTPIWFVWWFLRHFSTEDWNSKKLREVLQHIVRSKANCQVRFVSVLLALLLIFTDKIVYFYHLKC